MRHYDKFQGMSGKPRHPAFTPTDLRLLRIFLVVARNEGLAASQEELGLSAGTISNHVAHLEARFGVRLCERGRKGFSLTAEGVRILEAAENLLRSIENFTGIVGSVRGELTGTVHFGTVDAMHTNSSAPLHEAFARFRDLAPRVVLNVEIASPQDLLQRLLAGRYNLILTPIEEVHPSVRAHKLFAEEQRLYCGYGHPLFTTKIGLTPALVRKHPYVGRTYMKSTGQVLDDGFEQQALTAHMEALAILIKSGKYLGYLPSHFAQPFLERGEMRSLLDDEMAYWDAFYLAHRKDERNRATHLLADCLTAKLGKEEFDR